MNSFLNMFGLNHHCIQTLIRSRDDISFVFSLFVFDQRRVQSDFAFKKDDPFYDYENLLSIR